MEEDESESQLHPNISTLEWIDVSVPMRSGMVHWPGDPAPSFERISEIRSGADANVTLCRITAHTGTHMDAPCHFLDGAAGIETFPLEAGVGRARVIEIDATGAITGEELRQKGIRRGERILLRTTNSWRDWAREEFHRDFVALNASAAEVLAQAGVRLIGVDYLSVGLFEGDGVQTHRTLLNAGIWIVEGLDLSRVKEGDYDLICLPLRIEGADGSPARVILRPVSDSSGM